MAATVTFIESGSDATQDLTFYTNVAGATSSTSFSNTGPRAIRLNTGAGPTSALVRTPTGATLVNGNTVLSTNTAYRISISYTITNTTTFQFVVFLDGATEITCTAGTMTRTGSSSVEFSCSSGAGANVSHWFDDPYVDTGVSDYSDPGAVKVTNKRPNANGTTNDFVTQVGAGGSGYGSGHSPQVNEQPLSATNGWSVVTAGTAVTEEYIIESAETGDTSVSGTIRAVSGWVFGKALVPETASILVNGITSNIALTSTGTIFAAVSTAVSYPAATGTDIGVVTDTSITTVSLFECGVHVAYVAATGAATLSALGVQ